jgi:sulfoxide reductase heme-binding subunit YedZ
MKAAKHDLAQPMLFVAIVALLLGMRVWWARQKQAPARAGVVQQ